MVFTDIQELLESMAPQGSREMQDVPAMPKKVSLVMMVFQAVLVGKDSLAYQVSQVWESEDLTGSLGCPGTMELLVSQESQVFQAHVGTQVNASRSMKHW